MQHEDLLPLKLEKNWQRRNLYIHDGFGIHY